MKMRTYLTLGALACLTLVPALGPVLADTQTDQLLMISTAEVRTVSDRSVTVYWQANTGSQGEYRYGKNLDEVNRQSWSRTGVLNGAETGNAYGSGVTFGPLDPSTMYYVELRKAMVNGSESVYGPTKIISFTTLPGQNLQLLDVQMAEARTITGTSAMVYWQSNTAGIGQHRYATTTTALSSAAWQQTATNGSGTGNNYGSLVALANLEPGTTYYVEVRKIQENMTNVLAGQSRVVSFTTSGTASTLRVGDLVKSYSSPDVFWVDSARCLHWIVNEAAAQAHFGNSWTKSIFSYTEIPGPVSFCETLSLYNAPNTGDSDGDGISDADEARFQTATLSRDTDNDGLSDQEEIEIYGTNPLKSDTDGDGYSDIIEIRNGYNPKGAGMVN